MQNEKNISAEQEKKTNNVRVPQKNVYRRRAKNHQPKTSDWAQETKRLKDRLLISPTSFPKGLRILKRREFGLFTQKKKVYVGLCLIIDYRIRPFSIATEGSEETSDVAPKIGITVSRHFGNSVVRNRFKRLVRETFRLHRLSLAQNVDMIVKPKKGCSSYTFETIAKDLSAHAQLCTTTSCRIH